MKISSKNILFFFKILNNFNQVIAFIDFNVFFPNCKEMVPKYTNQCTYYAAFNFLTQTI